MVKDFIGLKNKKNGWKQYLAKASAKILYKPKQEILRITVQISVFIHSLIFIGHFGLTVHSHDKNLL